jgi:hypothetical protein
MNILVSIESLDPGASDYPSGHVAVRFTDDLLFRVQKLRRIMGDLGVDFLVVNDPMSDLEVHCDDTPGNASRGLARSPPP